MQMDTRQTDEQATATDNVIVASGDVAVLRYLEPTWDALPKDVRGQRLRELSERGYGRRETTHNTTCIELDEYRVANLNKAENENRIVSQLAVGDDSTTPTHSDRSLTNEIDRTDVSEYIPDGQTLTCRSFLAKAEGNGPDDTDPTLQELGLYAGSYFLNHSTFNGIVKTNQKAISFEIGLTFDTA